MLRESLKVDNTMLAPRDRRMEMHRNNNSWCDLCHIALIREKESWRSDGICYLPSPLRLTHKVILEDTAQRLRKQYRNCQVFLG